MLTLLFRPRPLSWISMCALGALVANCSSSRDYQEPSGGSAGALPGSGGVGGRTAAGGRSARGGAGSIEPMAGATSWQGGEAGTHGWGEDVAGAAGASPSAGSPGNRGGSSGNVPFEGGAGGVGGDASVGSAGRAGGAGRAGSGGAAEADECRFNVHCMDATRPFCNEAHRCVACLEATHCPAPSGECSTRSCVAGACREVAKPSGAACGSASSGACDAADTCDGAGRCLSNHATLGASCEDGVYCNGADKCDSQGLCAHGGSPCSGNRRVCQEDTKVCTCDTTTRLDASYCGTADEAKDRAAVSKAQASCLGCGSSDSDNFVRSSVNGCMEFRCKP